MADFPSFIFTVTGSNFILLNFVAIPYVSIQCQYCQLYVILEKNLDLIISLVMITKKHWATDRSEAIKLNFGIASIEL